MKCAKCGRELPGVQLDFISNNWQCAECAGRPTEAMLCRHGDKVVYAHTDAGGQAARIMAGKFLAPGDTYVVDEVVVGKDTTHIKLQGMRPVWFNSVLFDRVAL